MTRRVSTDGTARKRLQISSCGNRVLRVKKTDCHSFRVSCKSKSGFSQDASLVRSTLGSPGVPKATGGPVISSFPRKKANGFRSKPALREPLEFVVFENGYRLLQREARIQLAGPFFRDWGTSVRNI